MCMSIDDPFDALSNMDMANVTSMEKASKSVARLDIENSVSLTRMKYMGSIAIQLGLDDGKLAGIFSDGRIVIWDRLTNEIVAEFASYRSMLDFYAENP